jgi:hypothetical protein
LNNHGYFGPKGSNSTINKAGHTNIKGTRAAWMVMT